MKEKVKKGRTFSLVSDLLKHVAPLSDGIRLGEEGNIDPRLETGLGLDGELLVHIFSKEDRDGPGVCPGLVGVTKGAVFHFPLPDWRGGWGGLREGGARGLAGGNVLC